MTVGRIKSEIDKRSALDTCGAVFIGLLAMLLSSAIRGRASANSGIEVNNEESGWHKVDAGPFSILNQLKCTYGEGCNERAIYKQANPRQPQMR